MTQGLFRVVNLDEKKCPDCGHPIGESCGGDYLHKDDAVEYVADNYEPPEER